jgi:hypothetical protein
MKQQLKSPSSVADRDFEFSLDQAPARPAPSNDANFLMDEIFGDVEQALADSLVPPTEAVSLEYKKSAMEFDIATALANRYPQLALQLENAEAAAVVPEIPAPTTELAKPEEKQQPQQRQRTGSNLSIFERLMIFTGCASAIAALAVWVVSQGLVSKAANALGNKLGNSAVTATTAVPAVSEADAKFADYMLRALASIDRENAKDPNQAAAPISPVQAAAAAPAKSGTTLPQPIALSAPNNTAAKSGGPASKLAPPVRFEPPVADAEQGDVVTRSELNQVMNRIVGMLERVAPGVSNRLPLPQPVKIAAKPAASAATAAAPQIARATTPANLPQRVINGIVDFGDKSVVTFNVNGVTQRVYLGENVGSTGWTLIKVDGTRATFRKNGEFRTLGEGESL